MVDTEERKAFSNLCFKGTPFIHCGSSYSLGTCKALIKTFSLFLMTKGGRTDSYLEYSDDGPFKLVGM